jgi:hypothetical protein
VFSLNLYLKRENRLLYATGTRDKAFFNATWKMSRREVERANKTTLESYTDVFTLLDAPEVMNRDRFTEYLQKGLSLWGFDAEVHYSFFDNMLYEYYIAIKTYSPDKPYQEVVQSLQQQFGAGQPIPQNRGKFGGEPVTEDVVLLSKLDCETPRQKLSCWMGRNGAKEGGYYVGFRATYKPFYAQIQDVAKSEKKSYF